MSGASLRDARFQPTSWSLVQRAGDTTHPEAQAALAELITTYWSPVYAFIRRSGHSVDDALDLTQGFFTAILERGGLEKAERERGRFRSYLLGAVKFYLANERARARAQRRGGGQQPLSLDFASAERRYLAEPVADEPPGALFDRLWRRELLDRGLEHLRLQLVREGKPVLYDVLLASLAPDQPSYAEIAQRLGLSTNDVTNYLHRARRRFREALLAVTLPGVSSLAEAEAELRDLLG